MEREYSGPLRLFHTNRRELQSFSKRLLRGLVVIACSGLGFEMGLVDLYLEGVILVGTIGGRGREGKDVVRTCVTEAACDPVGYVVAGGQASTPTLSRKNLQREVAEDYLVR